MIPGVESKFLEVARRAADCFKTPVSEKYLERFTFNVMKRIGPYPDRFIRALDFCVEHKETFPSVSDIIKVITQLPLQPIDHIARGDEAWDRLGDCRECRSSGYLKVFKPEDGDMYDTYCFCDCGRGRHLEKINSCPGFKNIGEMLKLGYLKWRRP